ncbi:hypothetical protein [Methylobacterium indicum]|uniref:Uncharacterized protein n=1 Tax=Methylobacterium indicum TaxID=1775910 RepID=A0A8H8X0M0_9HYPH|nr:hypothetical protein [Methylobacterium indicum]BCM87697.1 hypothetical protein mvi_61580 [Methylobacterium indicum]
MAARSAIWLDAPPGIRAPEPGDMVRLCSWGRVGGADDLVSALAGHEIVLTAHVPVPSAILQRCRWVRAVVGLGPEATGAVDWEWIRSTCLVVGRVETAGIDGVEAAVRAELVRIGQRLHALDAIGEGWEGT